MTEDVRQVLKDFIQDQLMSGRGATAVTDDQDLLAGGVLDSLGAFQLVFFIEERFGVEVPPQDVTVENFSTICTIEAYIDQRRP